MKPFGRRRRAERDQTIIGSVIHGDVIYICDIAGDVTINKGERRYRYWCEPFPAVTSPRSQQAAAQPRLVLDPAYQIAPLVGRDQELDDLHKWLDGPSSVAVRLLHSEPGHGKTRVVEQLRRDAERHGWLTVQAVHTLEYVDESATVAMGERRALLMVVDDAHRWPAAHLEAVVVNLRALGKKHPEFTARLLLVARTPAPWWPVLAARLRQLAVEESAVGLAPLGLRVNRTEIFDSAFMAFRQALYAPPPQVHPPDPARYRADLDLAGTQFDSVLAVHMAALVAVHARANQTELPAGPASMAVYLLDNEYAEWSRRYDTGELRTRPQEMRRLVYLAALTRGLARKHARRVLIITHLADNESQAEVLLDDHARCYPDASTSLAPLKPELLAEYFLALNSPGYPEDTTISYSADAWVAGLADDLAGADDMAGPWIPQIISNLIESAGRWPHLGSHILFPLLAHNPLWVADAGEAALTGLTQLPDIEPAVLQRLHHHLQTTGDPAAEILQTALLPYLIETSIDDAERARLYVQHADQLGSTRRFPQACDATEQAVSLYRRLAEEQPQVYLPDLAAALSNLAKRLNRVRRFPEAVTLAEESVTLYRQLIEKQPSTYLPNLAAALSNSAERLNRVRRFPEAVTLAEESVTLYRQLIEKQPSTYLPDLAGSLNSLGVVLRQMGRFPQAVARHEEAAALYFQLAEDRPITYLPDLAGCLNNLGVVLWEVGRFRDAALRAEQAVALYRRFAERRPVRFLPDLASSLANLGAVLREMGRIREALAPSEEAVAILRRLAQEHPLTYLPDLASSLANLAVVLEEAGRFREAVAPSDEAVAIFRRLAEKHSETFLPDLAGCLNNLGVHFGRVGRFREAVARADEAVLLYRRLAADDPETYLSRLAGCLIGLGGALSEVRRYGDGVAAAEEAVTLYRPLAAGNPETYVPDLALSLAHLGNRLREVERFREAVAAADEAVTLYRQLVEEHSDTYVARWAFALVTFAHTTEQADDAYCAAGVAAAAEATQLYERLVAERPDAYNRALKDARDLHGRLLVRSGARDISRFTDDG
ncbi:tetratricopeptide repeat protein [Nocardia cyriacigeorgica]|uniref:Tetratricopeptide repeat protein n=1 Tax=Nocardia cyriacigeorgica (strain GUH-2) TaxID=1127134 RepID=H6RA76_NOCCG|nr:tetratricopeptide repeat protein [Nocardia cyriacigeorgica]BDT87326.1 hypothetical protein FMUAM8_30900 [Nocardia cyriacigeorgica]CCF63684.1 protein of unknown function, putative TPR domains [Nocardia cyriacigeorgica GUH-2]